MPRGKTGPTVPWPSLEQCTPLGTMLVEWMWSQRPPMPVALLAGRVGVDRSTLFSWLTTERQPQPLQLLLAQATELAVDDLAHAAGVPIERIARQRQSLYEYVLWEVEQTELLAKNDRASMTQCSPPHGANEGLYSAIWIGRKRPSNLRKRPNLLMQRILITGTTRVSLWRNLSDIKRQL